MDAINFEAAQMLAADLRGAKVDRSEVQKVLSYMRSQHHGKALFDYLQILRNNEPILRRSGKTVEHIRALQDASTRHLHPLQNDYERLMQTLGWAIRLLRYYEAISEIAPRYEVGQHKQVAEATPLLESLGMPEPQVSTTPPAQSRTGSSELEVDKIFRGKILGTIKPGVKIQHPNHPDIKKVIGLVAKEHQTGPFKPDQQRWFEIIGIDQEDAMTILWLKPAQNPEKKEK